MSATSKLPVRRIASVLADKAMRDELIGLAAAEGGLPRAAQYSIDTRALAGMLESAEPNGEQFDSRQFSEAIVLEVARPALLVRNDMIETPRADTWKKRLAPYQPQLCRTLRSVGRIELFDHPDFSWVGTGWMIAEGILVTNRHVAKEFAVRGRRGFAFAETLEGKLIRAQVDFKEEYRVGQSRELAVEKILYVADDGPAKPDIAFLKISSNAPLPPPLTLAPEALRSGANIGVIGYPARDSRNDANAMVKVFGDIYNVKRFSPGQITAANPRMWHFEHDCSTLGGNSGSAVVQVETGAVVGLHFGGSFRHSNYAVRADVLKKFLPKTGIKVAPSRTKPQPQPASAAAVMEKRRPVSAYADRAGYDPAFLGRGRLAVPLPRIRDSGLALTLADGNTVLAYTHFSVVMHALRRLPILTAVNIDGRQRRFLVRKSGQNWYVDPRLPRDAQLGAEFYGPTNFDRGHMVRREDPVWGTEEEASLANEDSFHYTNACPQHPDLNQKTWLQLENYILDNADVRDLRVCSFTGPVLAPADPEIRGVQVPLQFWKVAAVADNATGKLATAGYMQSQESLVSAMEFRFGAFKTYQVPIARIERLTGLDFGKRLREADALASRSIQESLGEGPGSIEIRSPADICIGSR
jgi:endonuclease G